MANEIIFIAFILYYIIEEALELKKHGFKYLFSVWNMLDIIVVGVSLIPIQMTILKYVPWFCINAENYPGTEIGFFSRGI